MNFCGSVVGYCLRIAFLLFFLPHLTLPPTFRVFFFLQYGPFLRYMFGMEVCWEIVQSPKRYAEEVGCNNVSLHSIM